MSPHGPTRVSCAHAEVACGGHADTITELGHLVWPKLAAAYIERRLAPAAPRDEAGLDAFQGMAMTAERFEGDAAATGCGPPTPYTKPPLGTRSCASGRLTIMRWHEKVPRPPKRSNSRSQFWHISSWF